MHDKGSSYKPKISVASYHKKNHKSTSNSKSIFTNYKRNMAKLELLNASDMADNKRVHHYNYAIKAVFSRL